MTLDRRELLGAMGGLAALRVLGTGATPLRAAPALPREGAPFPRRDDFAIPAGVTYLNAAYTHPIPIVSAEAARKAAERRSGAVPAPEGEPTPRELFARLINAGPEEIAYVSSTSAGENLVVRALELDHRFDGNVVTDGLHFEGALMHLDTLRSRGLDVRVVRPTPDARIRLTDLEAAMDDRTRLVEVSATAMYNGFQHDLAAIAEMAHARGALVYADIVHAAGAEPFDVKATGVDFAACSSFKWLMGDFGLGFLYAREEVWDRLTRPVVGYYQASGIEQRFPPQLPPPGESLVDYDFDWSAAGFFETGSLTGRAEVGVALSATSLEYVLALGVERIQEHRLPLIRRLQDEMPRLGFTSVTPPDATSANVTFVRAGLGWSDVPQRLERAGVQVRIAPDWMRVSPSVYNDMTDVEHLLDALR